MLDLLVSSSFRRAAASVGLVVVLTSCTSREPAPATEEAPTAAFELAINARCPRSGKPIAADSLTLYRERVVGFCNPHCRDDFAANAGTPSSDSAYFDAILAGEPEGGAR